MAAHGPNESVDEPRHLFIDAFHQVRRLLEEEIRKPSDRQRHETIRKGQGAGDKGRGNSNKPTSRAPPDRLLQSPWRARPLHSQHVCFSRTHAHFNTDTLTQAFQTLLDRFHADPRRNFDFE